MDKFEYTADGYLLARQYLINEGVDITGGFSTDGWSITHLANSHYRNKHKEFNTYWNSVEDCLPQDGETVLVYAGNYNQQNKFHVARFEKGISKYEREEMRKGNMPNPEIDYIGGIRGSAKRSQITRSADEYGNNQKPYCWHVSPLTLFGQYVTHWMILKKP